MKIEVKEIDLKKIEKTDSCWNWLGFVRKSGYGEISISGKRIRAHRYVYEKLIGKIPEGLELDHLCRNRKCVRPEHLEPVTHRENVLRGKAPSALHAKKTMCKREHLYSGQNLYLYYNEKTKATHRNCKECRKISQISFKKKMACK